MKDLTKGNVLKTLVLFSLPILGGRVLNTAYNIIDTIFVGRLGHEAIGAVSLSFNVIFVIISLAAGLTMGTTILISQYFGAGNKEMVNKIVLNSIVFVGAIAVVLVIIGLFISPYILKAMNTPEDIYNMSLSYMRIVLIGIIWMFMYFLISSILRGMGDSKTPFKFLIVSTIINIILDPILIFGWGFVPKLGVSGAAIATALSQSVAAFMGLYYLFNKNNKFNLKIKGFKLDISIIKNITKLGLPSGIAQMLMALGGTMLLSTINIYGSTAVTTYGIGMKVDSLIFMVIQSLTMGVSTMIGQNIGANLMKRVNEIVKKSLSLIASIALIYTVVYNLIPSVLIRIFTNDRVVLQPTIDYIRIVSLSYVFVGIWFTYNSVVRGAGAMKESMALTVINIWVIRIPLARFLTMRIGITGVWYSLSVSYTLGALISYLYYKYGKWRDKAVVKKDSP